MSFKLFFVLVSLFNVSVILPQDFVFPDEVESIRARFESHNIPPQVEDEVEGQRISEKSQQFNQFLVSK